MSQRRRRGLLLDSASLLVWVLWWRNPPQGEEEGDEVEAAVVLEEDEGGAAPWLRPHRRIFPQWKDMLGTNLDQAVQTFVRPSLSPNSLCTGNGARTATHSEVAYEGLRKWRYVGGC